MLETFINGLIPLSFIEYAIYTLVVTHITIVAIHSIFIGVFVTQL